MHNILDKDATEIADLIRKGEITSLQATTAFIEHLQVIQPIINAVSVDRYDVARQEAIQADLELKEGKATGRLHGVPISMKDCFHVAGMATTGGLKHRSELIEYEDAVVVAKLKAEGAIILAKTNTSTLCFCQESTNKLYGTTNNPWEVKRSAGGSSGGEGALIAAGGAAVGLGADIGGSIRFPSHYNGVVGFKSGNAQIDDKGNFPPVSIPEQHRMLGIGAIAKSVRDARLVNEIISNRKRTFVDLDQYKIIIPDALPYAPIDQDTTTILKQLQERVAADYKTSIEPLPLIEDVAVIWQELMSINGAKHLHNLLNEQGSINPLMEYIKEKITGKSELHAYLTWGLIGTSLFKPSDTRLQEIRTLLTEGDKQLAQYFKDKIAIIPVYHTSAQAHGKQYSEIFSIRKTFKRYMPYISYANVWGLPALTLPIAISSEGMPLAVQLITANGNEEALFQFGEWIEAELFQYRRCTNHDLK